MPGNPFKSLSRPQLYAAMAGAAGIAGYIVVRHHKATGSWNPWSAGAGGTSSGLDPVTGLPVSQDNVIDPVTGITYLAEAQQYGSVAAAEASVGQFGTTVPGSGGAAPPATYPVAGSPSGTQTGTPYATDAAWAQAVQAGLSQIGFDGQAVGAAIGEYLGQQPLTPDQEKIVRTALAEFGPPPQGLLPVISQPVTGPAAPKRPAAPAGLSVTPRPGAADIGWGKVTGAQYHVVIAGAGGPGTGTSHFDEVIAGNHLEHITLAPGRYVVTVHARNSAGESAGAARRDFTVAR